MSKNPFIYSRQVTWFQMQKHTLSSLSHMSRHPRSAPPSDVKNQLNKMAPNGLQSEMAEPSKRTTKQGWSYSPSSKGSQKQALKETEKESGESEKKEKGTCVYYSHHLVCTQGLFPRPGDQNRARGLQSSRHVLPSWSEVQQTRRNPSDSPGRWSATWRARNWTRSRSTGPGRLCNGDCVIRAPHLFCTPDTLRLSHSLG